MANEHSFGNGIWVDVTLGPGQRCAYRTSSVLFSGQSDFQDINLVDTPAFGKVLLLDGIVQSSESDEVIYHELLVHPTMLQHAHPKTVFIMGGGEGATAREVLRHKSVEQVIMVDIDKVVTDACREHLPRNKRAFADPRLTVINDDARAQLEAWPHKFDVIIGDLADPLDGGPCYQLYTQEFYRSVVLDKLNPGGVFVTQSGPAGFNSCQAVFTCIHRTLGSIFPTVLPYAQHMPSYCDTWGFNMALTGADEAAISAEELDARAVERIQGSLLFLDGETFSGLCKLNKMVRKALQEEVEIYTVDSARFIHGSGINAAVSIGEVVVIKK